jgi:hypothetical protein
MIIRKESFDVTDTAATAHLGLGPRQGPVRTDRVLQADPGRP